MNKSEIKTFDDMKRVVDTNTIILMRIDKCLNGDPNDRKDLGLVVDVRDSVRWQKSVKKVLGVLGLGVLTLWLKDVYGYFKGM